jgi:hypothetical protein
MTRDSKSRKKNRTQKRKNKQTWWTKPPSHPSLIFPFLPCFHLFSSCHPFLIYHISCLPWSYFSSLTIFSFLYGVQWHSPNDIRSRYQRQRPGGRPFPFSLNLYDFFMYDFLLSILTHSHNDEKLWLDRPIFFLFTVSFPMLSFYLFLMSFWEL